MLTELKNKQKKHNVHFSPQNLKFWKHTSKRVCMYVFGVMCYLWLIYLATIAGVTVDI